MADNLRNSYTDLVLGELKGEIKNIHTMRKECFADRKFKEEKNNLIIKEMENKIDTKASKDDLKINKKLIIAVWLVAMAWLTLHFTTDKIEVLKMIFSLK